MNLKGRAALVTGSTSFGMGRSIALTLAHRGADIVLNYGTNPRPDPLLTQADFGVPIARSETEAAVAAEAVRRAIEKLGRRVILVKADTKVEADVSAMAEKAEKELGPIDILVNNAGGGWHVRDYTKIPLEDWQEVLAAEINGAFLTMKYVVPGMRKRGWGRIIHVGLAGVMTAQSTAGVAADYCLGKAARAWMTRAFGLQEFKKGITVNCVAPGVTEHLAFEDALSFAQGESSSWTKREKANAHDVAELVAFLCSEAGRFVSGNVIGLPT